MSKKGEFTIIMFCSFFFFYRYRFFEDSEPFLSLYTGRPGNSTRESGITSIIKTNIYKIVSIATNVYDIHF